jgi:hypothetical protein
VEFRDSGAHRTGGGGMNTPMAAPGTSPKTRRLRPAVVALLIALALVVGGLVWLATALLAPSSPLQMTVALTPESPDPNEPFTITAIVEGGGPLSRVEVVIAYQAYFNSSSGGGGSHREGNQWSLSLGGFPNGTEVWIVVAAAAPNQPPLIDHVTVSIGNGHGGPSNLSITELSRTPEQPDPLDAVRVSARIESAANVTEVWLLARHFRWTFDAFGSGSSSGEGSMPMREGEPGNFSAVLGFPAPSPGGTERGTIWVYRVVASDESGGRAASSIESFTIR